MCSVLHVSASGYHAWRSQPWSARARANEELAEDIRRVHAGSQRRYGSPRVHASLIAGVASLCAARRPVGARAHPGALAEQNGEVTGLLEAAAQADLGHR